MKAILMLEMVYGPDGPARKVMALALVSIVLRQHGKTPVPSIHGGGGGDDVGVAVRVAVGVPLAVMVAVMVLEQVLEPVAVPVKVLEPVAVLV